MAGAEKPDVSANYTESIKLGFETVKQQTTLSAGSIVVIGTFLKDIFPSKHGTLNVAPCMEWLIALSFAGFVLSLLSSAIALSYYSRRLRLHIKKRHTGIEPSQTPFGPIRNKALNLVKQVALFSYTSGLLLFSVAVVLTQTSVLWPELCQALPLFGLPRTRSRRSSQNAA